MTEANILMVIAPRDFRDQEYNDPRKIFDNEGIKVKVASTQKGISIGADGTAVKIDLSIGEVKAEEFRAVVFIGGPGMVQIIDDENLQILAKEFYGAGKITAAICVAPAILAKAGILSSKKATAWPGVENELIAKGALFSQRSVVVDGKIITANGPASAREFGEEIVKALQ